ncbi:hypothetical protein L9F63_002737 [Diploptera punctata]|uniref:TIR domain-containing protein n=1 Tax=Diploptera punctata TaxID=6984 RepID=A0AAD7ZRY3_DIPPU|nr:hypothetical protein L9F63_002737 [Diploptera punctata]
MNRTGCLDSDIPGGDSEFDLLPKLKVLDLSNCNLQHLNASTFTKFPNLEFLYLSSNQLSTLPSNFTLPLINLKELHLAQNYLTSVQLYLPQNLTVDVLDISNNLLSSPAHIVYSGKVWKLDLSSNNISGWNDPNIFVAWVRQIDLSNNHIDFITVNMRTSFQELISVNLSSNPIDCRQCRTAELQKWFKESSPSNIHNFTCAWPLQEKGEAVASVKIDPLSCTKSNMDDIPVIISLSVLGTGVLVAILLLYKYRLQIAYTVHALGMKRRYKAKRDNGEKEYDAFVCYSSLDTSWVCNELSPSLEKAPENYKFCIHERDFPVGTFIMRNIDSAIKKSRHTIVVLSNRFLTSSWCRWELELTNYTMIHEDRDLIIMIELEHLDKHKIPRFLKFLMNTRTYLEWPKKNADQAAIDSAWKKIRLALGVSLSQQKLKDSSSP